MNRIPTQTESPNGLHQRYAIKKIVPNVLKRGDITFVDPGRPFIEVPCDDYSEYFVLRLDEGGKDLEHIKACRIGVHSYADAIQHHLPELAKDLKGRYPLL